MEITRIMEVSKQEFSDFIVEMIIADIKNCTGKDVDKKEIVSGYTYQKELTTQLGKKTLVTTKLLEIVPGSYKAQFSSIGGENTLTYEYHETGESQIEVNYVEDYIAATKTNEYNFKLMSFIQGKKTKKKINNMLENMERYIIEQLRDKKED